MKISRLMEQHQKFKSQGLPGNFGDGYLMANNATFRKIREAALGHGYKFSNERNEAYEAFPLLQLESLLQTKKIPYSNNVVPFEHLTAIQLEAISWEDIDGNLKRNFVFHEGCHAVVRSLAKKHLAAIVTGHDIESHRLRALRMLLEESCSNTAELLGVTEAQDQIHRLFYEINSYVCEFESRTQLKSAMSEIGAAVFVPFMVLSYLHSNFLRVNIDDRSFQDLLAMSGAQGLPPQQIKTLRALSKISFNLSERFRFQTTGFHLHLAGVKTPIRELFDFDFLSLLRKDPGSEEFLKEFAWVLSV